MFVILMFRALLFVPFISKCPRLYASVQLEHRGLQPAPQKNQG